jgi:hypothetical protein
MPDNSYASLILGGTDRNVEKLGAYVAWLINNRLFTDYIERTCESEITDVRLQSTTGADFLATALHGELTPNMLEPEGKAFTERYLLSGKYDEDYQSVEFIGDDEWVRYADLAPLISKAFRGEDANEQTGVTKKLAKVLKFPGVK